MAQALRVQIIGDDRAYSAALKRATATTGRFSSSMGKLSKAASFVGFSAGATAVTGLTAALTVGLDELREHAKVAAQTNAVLKSTGGVANVTARDVENLAQSIMRKTGIDDEAIQSSENLLLGFTNIRNELGKGNDVFNQATMLVQDYAVRTGRSATSASIVFGKALNDPIKGLGALSRVGITFTDAQKKQIKAMVDSGNVMGAQKVILAELEKRYGGAAEAAGKTLPGQIAKLNEEFRNLSAQGLTIAFNKLRDLGPTFQTFAGVIRKFSDVLKPLAAFIFDNLVVPFKLVADLIRGDWTQMWQDAKAPVMDFVNFLSAIWGHLSGVIMPGVDAIVASVTGAWNTISSTTAGIWDGIVSSIVGAWDGLSGGASDTFSAVADAVTGAWDTVSSSTQTVWDGINSTLTGIWNGLSSLASTVFASINTAVTTAWNAIGGLTTTVWSTANTLVTGIWNGLNSLATSVFGSIKNTVTTAWNFIGGTTTTVWNSVKNAVVNAINFAKNTVVGAVNTIKSYASFSGLSGTVSREWHGIQSAITGAINAAKGVVVGAAKAIRGAINDTFKAFEAVPGKLKSLIIAPINHVIDLINSIRIPGFSLSIDTHLPGVGTIGFSWGGYTPFHIPHLAQGGIVTQPTLAMIGEKGPEAVVPLSNGMGAGGGIVINLTVNAETDDPKRLAQALVDPLYRELVRKSGRNVSLGLS